MGYFKNITVWGINASPRPIDFVVPCSVMIKFAVFLEFDKFSPKSQKSKKVTSLSSYDVIFCFSLPFLLKFLKFRNSLFLASFAEI